MDLILEILFWSFIKGGEWKKVEDFSSSPFLELSGFGQIQVIYRRSYTPSIVNLVVEGFFAIFVSIFILIFMGASIPSVFMDILRVFLFLLFFLFGIFNLWRIYDEWPTRSPQTVGVFENCIAWLENDASRCWTLAQITDVKKAGNYFHVKSRLGNEIRFHIGLFETEFGKKARTAARLIRSPEPMIKCPNCGQQIAGESTRCIFCLEPVTSFALKPCPVCGELQTSKDDLFCRHCGAPLREKDVQ